MHRSSAIFAAVALAGLSGCAGPQPHIRNSGADWVEIMYAGDMAATAALARRHCAAVEKVPRLRDATTELATYDCVKP